MRSLTGIALATARLQIRKTKGGALMKRTCTRALSTALLLLLLAFSVSAGVLGGYHLVKKVAFASPGTGEEREYFDYITVDAAARRVYLSHGTEVLVVDADTFATIGKIPGLKLAHGIVLLKELGRGFISDGGGNRVVTFELQNLQKKGEIKAGGNPDCIIYDSASKHIFTFNGNTKDSSVIDPATETVIATVPMGGRAEFAASDGNGMIYDNIENTSEVVA